MANVDSFRQNYNYWQSWCC